MEANPVKVIQYFDGTKQNVVPLFQRSYTWEKKNWQTLWDDILGQYEHGNRSSHFMGAIVSMPLRTVPVGVNKYLIIDGQQRLTTVALILCALRQVLDEKRSGRIEDYLVNRHHEDPDYLKFVPTNSDREIFWQLVTGQSTTTTESNRMVSAVDFFVDAMGGCDADGEAVDPIRILETIEHCLQVVMINLGDADDPYLIFESLNHKGEPLEQADLVRNYVLMRFRHSLRSGGEQDEVYTELWKPIENSLGKHLTEFLRHYAMKGGEVIKKDGVYSVIKSRFSSTEASSDVKAELLTMRNHAESYQRFVYPDRETRVGIQNRLQTIMDLDVTTCYPLLLRLFEYNRTNSITDEELENCLHVIESYVARRAIVGVATNPLARLFVGWSKNVPILNPYRWLIHTMSATTGNGRWPGNEEFQQAFEFGSQYGRKWTKHILVRLERSYGHKERVDLTNPKITVEHVMPQRLNDSWKKMLGLEYAAVHERLIHTYGNLTLTAYNPELSNDEFAAKRVQLRASHLDLNRSISEQSEWTQREILERARELSKIAQSLWVAPN